MENQNTNLTPTQDQAQAQTHKRHFKSFWPIVGIAVLSALVGGLLVWSLFNQGLEEELNSLLPGVKFNRSHVVKNVIDTSDWQTYNNEEYGFEFKYPKNLSLSKDIQKSYSILFIGGNTLHISASLNKVKESDVCDGALVKPEDKWCVDGNPDDRWVSFQNNENIGVTFYCWFPKSQSNISTCNQILSTFKFTEPQKTTLMQVCPDEWIDNQMPTVGTSTEAKEYYIYQGKRYELNQFDSAWLKKNCVMYKQVVY